MYFCLECRPLARCTDQVHDFCLDCLDIALILLERIHVTPNIEHGRRMPMPPSIAVIAGFSFRIPPEAQPISNALFGDTDVNRLAIYTCE
jgi:hypothetical protein